MSSYPPPTEILPIFNDSNYDYGSSGLTFTDADTRYLRLTGGVESGLVAFNAGITATTQTTTGAALFGNGTLAAPSLSFASETGTGLYLPSAGAPTLTTLGAPRLDFATTGAFFRNGTSFADVTSVSTNTGSGVAISRFITQTSGASRAGGLLMTNTLAPTNSLYIGQRYQGGSSIQLLTIQGSSTAAVPNSMGGASTGLDRILINYDTGATQFLPGTVALPTITWQNDTNCGIWQSAVDNIDFTCGGTNRLNIASTLITPTVPIAAQFGTTGNPSFTFTTDADTGVYHPATNTVGISGGGTTAATFSNTAITNSVPMSIPAATAAAPAIVVSGSATTGIYSDAANTLKFTASGTNQMTISSSGVSFTSPPSFTSSYLILTKDVLQTGNSTIQNVTFDQQSVSGSAISRTTSSTFTVNTTGLYMISYLLCGSNGTSAATSITTRMTVNTSGSGDSTLGQIISYTASASWSASSVNIVQLTTADVLRLQFSPPSNINITILADSGLQSYLCIYKLF